MTTDLLTLEQEPEKTRKWNCQRLIFQRTNSRLSQKQMANAIGVSQKQITCMENCTRIPSKEMLATLVSFFDVPDDYFGVEAVGGTIDVKPTQLSPQDERQQAAKERLIKQRRTLRRMMRIAGFSIDCTGLHNLAEAIDEPLSDACKFVNGEFEMPPETIYKVREWFSTIPKTSRTV